MDFILLDLVFSIEVRGCVSFIKYLSQIVLSSVQVWIYTLIKIDILKDKKPQDKIVNDLNHALHTLQPPKRNLHAVGGTWT